MVSQLPSILSAIACTINIILSKIANVFQIGHLRMVVTRMWKGTGNLVPRAFPLKKWEKWPEVNHVSFTFVNAWNELTHKITRWLTDLNCICTLFVNVTIMFILVSSVIIIQMAKTFIFWPFLFWAIQTDTLLWKSFTRQSWYCN